MAAFVEQLRRATVANRSLLCVGLDPDPSLMPVKGIAEFNRAIVESTRDLVCAYKPNLSFYEAQGLEGIGALEETVSYIRTAAPDVVVLGDAKRGDIGSSNAQYAKALFETWDFDAATVNAYAGGDAIAPFLDYTEKGVFVWCRSSNPGAAELQDLTLVDDESGARPLYEWVARRANDWNANGNVGLVVGATYPAELGSVRAICPDMPVLVPGLGVQGGDLKASVRAGIDATGRNLIVSSSRSILYASGDKARFADAARREARRLRDDINGILEGVDKGW